MRSPPFLPGSLGSRTAAGGRLAGELLHEAGRPNVLVLGIPRGGVPVAAALAERLRLPLDVLPVRRLRPPHGFPGTLGAVAPSGSRFLDADAVTAAGLLACVIDRMIGEQTEELLRLSLFYREGRPAVDVRGRTILLVDDAIVSGATMRAAIAYLREHRARRIVAVAPVIASHAYLPVRGEADAMVTLELLPAGADPARLYAEDHEPTNEEVAQLLAAPA